MTAAVDSRRVPAHELVDAAVQRPVLVYGSLPPHGRDLDLLVRPAEAARLADALGGAGFHARGEQWVRFADCSVEIVELTPASSWGLKPAALDALYAQAVPLSALRGLVAPSPHHTLLILALRLALGDGRLTDKLRRRVDAALAADPDAWETARDNAPGWGATRALELAQRAHAGLPVMSPQWRDAAAERYAALGTRPARASLRRVRGLVVRWRRGGVVALSGLDGAGKSSQARALQATLERLGIPATIVWSRIAWSDRLWKAAVPAKKVLTRLATLTPRRSRRAGHAGSPATPADPIGTLRERSSLLTGVWTTVIALENALMHRSQSIRLVRRGTVVICDRYTLDSIVGLRTSYGAQRHFRFQTTLMRLVAPRPRAAYLLDVTPQTALARKGEYDLATLGEQARFYHDDCERIGVRRLDGELPQEQLCAEIALNVWQTLG